MLKSAFLPKVFVLICLFSLGLLLVVDNKVIAQLVDQTKVAFGLPTPIVEQQENLNLPDSIYITPIKIEASEFISTSDWYKGLFYYQAFRLNQGDFLFHYIVNKQGEILEGNSRGEEQRFALQEDQSKPVIIAYLAEKDDTDFSPEATKALGDLIIEIANRNRIPLEKVQSKSLEYTVTEEQEIVAITDITTGRWDRSTANIVKANAGRYDPDNYEFKLAVTEVKVPEGQVSFGQDVVAEVTIKNNSTVSLYQDSDFEPIMSKIGEDEFSKFFLNGVWLGPKQTSVMSEGANIRPGKSKSFKVRLSVPLYFGKQTEKFELVNSLGQKYQGSEFEITLDVKKTEKQAVEIAPNSAGYLNVRKEPSISSESVTRVSPGQRFLVLEKKDGWLKIDAGANGKGWIAENLTNTI